jgi:hypothetical protein
MIDMKTIMVDLFKTRDLQKWLNNRYHDPSQVIISKATISAISELTLKGDIRLPFNEWTYKNIESIGQVFCDYQYGDLLSTDKVLDIGANIGIFTLLAAKKECNVTAVEPLFYPELEYNLSYNSLKATILPYALGAEGYLDIEYAGRSARAPLITMAGIKKLAGMFDFLKCDCEGGEWALTPEDLEGFRRLEMELHNLPSQVHVVDWSLVDWIKDNFESKIEVLEENRVWLLHAVRDR